MNAEGIVEARILFFGRAREILNNLSETLIQLPKRIKCIELREKIYSKVRKQRGEKIFLFNRIGIHIVCPQHLMDFLKFI